MGDVNRRTWAEVGEITYEAKHANPQQLRDLHALAGYALYSGVGIQTTMGMGQCDFGMAAHNGGDA